MTNWYMPHQTTVCFKQKYQEGKMETANIAKQVISFQKSLFDNTYNAVTAMQDNSENMMNGILKQFPWVTEEVKKPLNESIASIKKTRNDYKKTVDQGFDKLEELIGGK